MRNLSFILILSALFIFPSLASAQTDTTLASAIVQLWPEYDQPSMLVITEFELPADAAFPVTLSFRIPQEANLIAVASRGQDGNLVNAPFDDPKVTGKWQTFTITLETAIGYFEYYQPLEINGEQRTFTYIWDNGFAVDSFSFRALEPLDTTSLTASPELSVITQEGTKKYFVGKTKKLASGEQFKLKLEYKKTSDALASASQSVQPSAPVDATTQGRFSWKNALPYVIGSVGVILIFGGLAYFFQANKSESKKPRVRARTSKQEESDGAETYCAQCGMRANSGDRFCRTCGSRIRQSEE